jgi:hypothetical protein
LLECNIYALLCLIAMVILLIVFLTLEKNSLLTELDNQRLSRRTNKRNIKREREGKEKP